MAEVNGWNERFYGCFDDMGICCYGYWCSSCLFGSNAKKINGSNCLLMCCIYGSLSAYGLQWIPHYLMREKLRRNYDLQEDESCTDMPATICCGSCALCQEAREMRTRGPAEQYKRKVVYNEQPRADGFQNVGYHVTQY